MLAKTVGFMGAGRMATALGRGLVRAGKVRSDAISATDPSDEARRTFLSEVPGANAGDDNVAAVGQADVVFLAVKPQTMGEALAALKDAIRSDALVVSIAAGITLERLAGGLPQGSGWSASCRTRRV